MKKQQRIELAVAFIMAQKSLDDCYRHEQIQHQLRAAGMKLIKRGEKDFAVECDGETVAIRSLSALLQFLG